MAVGPDANDERFATLDRAGIVELCSSLADYGEAGGLSRDLMMQVGRFAEARFGRDLEVLLAVSRMYLLGGETIRAKAALLRAGKLWPDETRVRPLLAHTLELLDDPRPVDQAIREAPALPPLHATPPPMPAVRPGEAGARAPFVAGRVMPPPRATPPGLPVVKLPSGPASHATTPRMPRVVASATTPIRAATTRPPTSAGPTPAAGTAIVPRAPGLPRGVEGAMNSALRITGRGASALEPAAVRGNVAVRVADSTRAPGVRTEPSRPREPAPDSAPRVVGGTARVTRIRFLDPDDERRHLDPYELIGEIAAGGMATVFLARLAGAGGFQRFVAIKRLHPHLAREEEFVEMFLDEARIAAGIHHPHVVPILEVGTSDAGYFLVMEFVEGDTLSGLTIRSLQRGAMLPPTVALRIVVDGLTGLHAAHDLHDADGRPLGLVHRDCTPQNILVGVDGSARITDFGVARAASRITMTRPQQVKGKVAYLSPEQAHAHDLDRRSDIFTMGIVLWEALAGRPLFQAESEAVTITRLLTGAIPSLRSFAPDVPAALDDVCLRALNRDPTRRFRTAAEMVEAIERAANAEGSIGIASPRDLGRFVDSVMGAEIAAQREAVRAWLAQSSDAAPMSRGSRSTAGMPVTPRASGSWAPTSGIHSSAPPGGPRLDPVTPAETAFRADAGRAQATVPPPAAPAEPAAPLPVERERERTPATPARVEAPTTSSSLAPAAAPGPVAVPADATLPAGPAPLPIAHGTAPRTPPEVAIVEPPARARLRLPAALSRLLAVKVKTRTGVLLVTVLVLLATAPLAFRAISSRRARSRLPAGARGPRTGTATGQASSRGAPARLPAAKPTATGWDTGDWVPPDGGPSGEDEPPAEK